MYCGQITLSKMDENLPISKMSTLSIHIPSLVKIHWYLLKLNVQKWKYGCVTGRQHCQKLMKFAHQQSQSRSPQYRCTQQVGPASVAQLDAPSNWRPGGRGFNPRRGRQHSFVEIDREIFSTVILSLPLIQEGQLSVSGERMCTILINRLED